MFLRGRFVVRREDFLDRGLFEVIDSEEKVEFSDSPSEFGCSSELLHLFFLLFREEGNLVLSFLYHLDEDLA